MKKFLFSISLFCFLSCSKSSETTDDMKRTISVAVVDYNPPNLTNHYWAVQLSLDKNATMTGNIIVQHDLWDLGQFKKTYIDTFDFQFNNQNFFRWNTNRNSLLQGPEIKNIRINKITQTTGDYSITTKP